MADSALDKIIATPAAPSPMESSTALSGGMPTLSDLALATRQAGLPAGVEGLLAKQLVDADLAKSRFDYNPFLGAAAPVTPSITAAEPESFFAPLQRQFTGFGSSLLNALTLGFGAEARAIPRSLLGGTPYREALQQEQVLAEQAAQEAPTASDLGTVAGLFGPATVARFFRGAPAGAAAEVGAAAGKESLAAATDRILSKYYLGETAAAVPTVKELAQIGAVQGAISGAGAAEPLPGQEDTLMTRARGAVGGLLTGALTTPVLGKAVEGVIRGSSAAKGALDSILPAVPVEEERIIGELLRSAGLKESEIRVALRKLQETSNPLLPLPYEKILAQGEQLPLLAGSREEAAREARRTYDKSTITLGELTGNPNIMRLEDLVKQGKGIAAAEFSKSIENANSAIKKHLDQIAKTGTPEELYKSAKDSVNLIRGAHEAALNESETLYTAFHELARNTQVTLPRKVGSVLQSNKTKLLGGLDREVSTALKGLEDKAQTRAVTVEDLWQARSTILDAADKEKASSKGKFYSEIAKDLETAINDSAASKLFNEAETFYTNNILSRFDKNPGLPTEVLAEQYVGRKTTDYKVLNPDKIQQELSANRVSMAAAAKTLQDSKQSKKLLNNLLEQKFSEFDALGTDWAARRKWIVENKSAFDGTKLRNSWRETLSKSDKYLQDVDELLSYKTRSAPPVKGKMENLNLENAEEAIVVGEILEGTANSAGRAAIRQFLRDRTRQVLGRTLSSTQGIIGSVFGGGLAGMLTGSLGAGLTAGAALATLQPATVFLRNRLNTRIDRLNARLVRALTDPRYALDVMQMAAIQNEKRALQEKQKELFIGNAAAALGIPGGRLAASLASQSVANAVMGPSRYVKPAVPSTKTAAPMTTKPSSNSGGLNKIIEAVSDVVVPKAEASPLNKEAISPILELTKKNEKEIAELNKYDPLTQAVGMAESRGHQDARSRTGAIGVMQLMPKSAKALGVDPEVMKENIAGGAKYLQQLQKRFGDRDLAIAAYNMGETRLARLMRLHDAETWQDLVSKASPLSRSNPDGVPVETIRYVKTVLGFLQRGKQ